jgi:hypothetical protein
MGEADIYGFTEEQIRAKVQEILKANIESFVD